jgi:Ribonuclease G/E
MDYTYRITEWEQAQERAELSEAAHRIYELAVNGKWQGWELEAVGGQLLMAGLSQADAQDVLNDIAAERAEKTQRHYLADAYTAAKRALPEAVDGRLERGLELALAGAVMLSEGGALIKSQKDDNATYTINGQPCTCPDSRAPIVGGRKACKHQIAAWLVMKARELMVWED